MDSILCDELLQEIFTRITTPSSSSSSSSRPASLSVSLVSKRWLHLYRTSRTSLSLKLNPDDNFTLPSLSTVLSHYPFISSLSILLSSDPSVTSITTTGFNDHLLFIVSSVCSKLKQLRFLTGPVSFSSLVSLSNTCTLLTSLTISLSRPLFFNWVAFFCCLKELFIHVSDGSVDDQFCSNREHPRICLNDEFDAELGLENLSLSGIHRDDCGVGWLWRSCKNLKKLQLKNCGGFGDGGSFFSFVKCLQGLEEVEIRKCRSIVDVLLLKLAENCDSLNSLLVYDGGSREGLLEFISNCRCNLSKIDLRLPLDLDNSHLLALAVNFRSLSSIKLQSCCLVTGEGLKALSIATSSGLEELALINCDVVQKEPGLLATLGQNLKQLKKLDLSLNEFLYDKEFISMLASCNSLVELKLRACRGLTGAAMLCLSRSCKKLKNIDIMHCCRINAWDVESFILNLPQLKLLQVEEHKLSDVARQWTSRKFIEVVA